MGKRVFGHTQIYVNAKQNGTVQFGFRNRTRSFVIDQDIWIWKCLDPWLGPSSVLPVNSAQSRNGVQNKTGINNQPANTNCTGSFLGTNEAAFFN